MRLSAALALLALSATPLPTYPDFPRIQLLEETSEDSAGVSLGDLNGDGRLDIVLAKGRHKPLHDRILINDGKGSYIASNLSSTPDRTYSAALSDLDLDGDLDIVVSNDAPDRKLVYFNDGRGRFAESSTFGEPTWVTRYVTIADLNGDRYPDLIAANRGGGRPVPSFVCLNDRSARFPSCRPLPTESATSIVAHDLDNDGALDLFVPHRDGGQSVILWNDGAANFTSTVFGPARSHARIGAAGDLNGDKLADLVFIDEARKAAYYALNLDRRRFSELTQLPAANHVPYALALADLNRDSQLDIIIGWVSAPGSIYFNQGRAASFHEQRWNDGKGVVYSMAFHDIDGNGWPDIVAARSDAPNAIWFAQPPAKR